MPGLQPTLDEVARKAGVSRSTASRAINGGMRVSPAALVAVNEAVARLGFSPNRAARALATQHTGSIALVIPEPDERFLSDPFLLGVLRGVSLALASRETQLVLLIANPAQPVRQMARYLSAGHVDGAIIASPHEGDHLEDDLRGSRPVIFIGRPFESSRLSFVGVDNVEGSRLGTQALIDGGRTRLGTITGPMDMTAGIDRLAGWRIALEAAGLPTDAVELGDFSMHGAQVATERLLARFPDIDGIFVASDTMAIGVRRALEAAGRRVPQDVALVGFDNLGAAEGMTPRLTTVNNPLLELVDSAAKLLLERIADPSIEPQQLILSPHLVPGGTV